MAIQLGEPLETAAPTGNAQALFDAAFVKFSARERWQVDNAARLLPQLLPHAHKLVVKNVDDPVDRACIVANRMARSILWYGLDFEVRRKINDVQKAEREARKHDDGASPAQSATAETNPFA